MNLSPTFSGSFTSTGANVFIPLEIGCDWFDVLNYSTQGSPTAGTGSGQQFFWRRGMPQGSAIQILNTAGATTLTSNVVTVGGFWYQDTSLSPLGPLYSDITGGVAATRIFTTTNTTVSHNIAIGSIVRLYSTTGALQLGGYDFTVTAVGANTWTIGYMVNFTANATAGSYRVINWNPLYYPVHRSIVSISNAANPVVVFSVTHGYTVGQQLRFTIPTAFGMVQLDGLTANIIGVNTATNSVTIDVDTTSFTPFAFPLTTAVPFSQALAVPIGEGLSSASPILVPNPDGSYTLPHDLLDATHNISQTGMLLYGGTVSSPAGMNTNVIYWRAGKSANI